MKSPLVKVLFLLLLFFTILNSCKKEEVISIVDMDIINIPIGFPSINFPPDNEFTKERWELGKQLFYDKQLSKSNTISCASCHRQEYAFSDNVALSLGDNNTIGTINSPTLTNVAYHPYYTNAGGVPSLEMQVLVPIQEHNEFNTNMLDIIEKLKKIVLTIYKRKTRMEEH